MEEIFEQQLKGTMAQLGQSLEETEQQRKTIDYLRIKSQELEDNVESERTLNRKLKSAMEVLDAENRNLREAQANLREELSSHCRIQVDRASDREEDASSSEQAMSEAATAIAEAEDYRPPPRLESTEDRRFSDDGVTTGNPPKRALAKLTQPKAGKYSELDTDPEPGRVNGSPNSCGFRVCWCMAGAVLGAAVTTIIFIVLGHLKLPDSSLAT